MIQSGDTLFGAAVWDVTFGGLNDNGDIAFRYYLSNGVSGIALAVAGQSPLPGDYNQNGTVDAADFTVWRNKLGSGTSLPNDDTTGVDTDDYDRWKTNFSQTAGSGALSSRGVPEPATWALLMLVAAGWSLRRLRTV